MNRLNKRQIGTDYEEQAVAYLKDRRYHILERNYRNRYGEIDIIAKDQDGVIVYFEIKFRRNSRYGEPVEAVDTRKQKKICKTALYHYSGHGYVDCPCRFDVIGICGEQIEHIEHAFEFCF